MQKDDQIKPAKIFDTIDPLDINEELLIQELANYFENLEQSLKESLICDPQALLYRANAGQDPRWYKIYNDTNPQELMGFGAINIDNSNYITRRIVFIHFSVSNKSEFKTYLHKFVNYVWKNDPCSEIKVSLFQLKIDDKIVSDPELQEAYKSINFKWKQLTNDKETQRRIIDYGNLIKKVFLIWL